MSKENKFKYINEFDDPEKWDRIRTKEYEELDALYDRTCILVPLHTQVHYSPVFGENNTWYFKNLVYGGYYGPFDTKEVAAETCREYAKQNLAFGKYSHYNKTIEESINEVLVEQAIENGQLATAADLIKELEDSLEAGELQLATEATISALRELEEKTPWYKKYLDKVKAYFSSQVDFAPIYLEILAKFEVDNKINPVVARDMWFNYLNGRIGFGALPDNLKEEAVKRVKEISREFRRRYPFRYAYGFCSYYVKKTFKFIARPWMSRV